MSRITTPKKLDGLDDVEILFLYRQIIYFWECNSSESFKISKGKFREFAEDKSIAIKALKKRDMPKVTAQPGNDNNQYFMYFHNESSQAASLIKRLRNATAHCNIAKKKISNRWFHIFTDYDNSGNCTLVGKIGRGNLKQFIEYLKSTRKDDPNDC